MHVLMETERLTLRRFTDADADHLYDLDNDPEVMRYINGGTPTSRDAIQDDILPVFLAYDERYPGYGFWAAIAKDSGDFLGWFSFRPAEGAPGEVVLGYRLRRAAWGKGYATEGARALIGVGFSELGVRRVVATTYEDNLASRRVMEKLGMTLVRRFRITSQDIAQADTYHATSLEVWDGDDVEYALERAGWERQQAKSIGLQTGRQEWRQQMSTLFHGPLRVHPDNGRYFTDDSGKAIYLTGSHTWANLQDIGLPGDPPFPYVEYLDFMQAYHHNFMRLWMFEQPERACWTDSLIVFDPLPWARTGPELANDAKPRFDLTVWNRAYFERLRQRVVEAGQRGIYCAVMLFQGWSLNVTGKGLDPWAVHPFNAENNVNGVDVPFTGWDDPVQPSLHSMHNPQVLVHQEAYVRQVIDTVNDLDNVLYEIINEGGSSAWQNHVVDLIHSYERGKPKQHPVGITSGTPWIRNAPLAASAVDWYSPVSQPNWWDRPGTPLVEDYKEDPPAADGRKVMLPDTDHLWGHGGNPQWVWKCFTRGHNPIFMDPWQGLYLGATEEIAPWSFTGGISKDQRDYPDWVPTRRAMGDTRRYAEKLSLAHVVPHPEWASTRYCLAHPGEQYLVYLPQGGSVTLDLCQASGQFAVEWFLPQVNRVLPGARPLPGGDYAVTTAPFTGDAVLYLRKVE